MASVDPFGNPLTPRSGDRWRVVVYPVLVLLALGTLAAHVGWLGASGAVAKAYRTLRGQTDEQQSILVEVEGHNRIHAIKVELVGLCENGGRYTVGWAPDSPRIPFRDSPRGSVARETGQRLSKDGMASRTVAWTTARVGPRGGAAWGDVRYKTSFRYPDGRRLHCDSGYVHWSAGQAEAANGIGPNEAGRFPPVVSLAISPSPARRRFALALDRTCAVTSNEIGVRKRLRRQAHEAPIARFKAWVADHQRQYDAITRLGPTPEATDLYRSWRANMRARIHLEWVALQRAPHDRTGADAVLSEVEFLKIEGDSLGQEFGLRICTSNGPLRSATRAPIGIAA